METRDGNRLGDEIAAQPSPQPRAGRDHMPSCSEMLADVIIRTRTDLVVSRHFNGGKPQYYLQDEYSFQAIALSLRGYRIYASFDGTRQCSGNFERLVAQNVLKPEDEEEYYGFILALHQRNVLDLPISDGKQLYERYLQRKARMKRSLPMRMLCWKQSLGSPDRILNRCTPILRFLFSWQALVIWFIANLLVANVVISRWDELVSPLANILETQNIFALLIILCGLKIWHELGHGVACRMWGGKVLDWGLLFILGTPCAYVDTTGAWSIPSRFKRIVISLGGIYFESFVAIAAMLVWCFAENPSTRLIANQTMLLATITTLLFNINPLMKFDGYFVLSDALNIANLWERAAEALRWGIRRFLLGLDVPVPEENRFRLVGLIVYGGLAALYRVLIVSGIITFLMWRSPVLGVLLASIYLAMIGSQKMIGIGKYLWWHPETVGKRRQATLATTAIIGTLAAFAFFPVNFTLTLPGVFGYQNEHLVRAPASGIIDQKLFDAGESVQEGDVIATFSEPSILQEIRRTEAELSASRSQLRAAIEARASDVQRHAHKVKITQEQLASLKQRKAKLELKSSFSGKLIDWQEDSRVGNWLPAGETIARVGSGQSILRVLVNQRVLRDSAPRVGEDVFVVLSWDWKHRIPAKILSVAACSLERISDVALTQLGGGEIEVSSDDMRPASDVFQIEVLIDSAPEEIKRVGVRGSLQLPNRRTRFSSWVWYRWLDFYRGFLREQV